LVLFFLIPLFAAECYAAQYRLQLGRPGGPVAKISSQVLRRAYDRIGIAVAFIDLPAERSLQKSSEGSLDGEVNRIAGIEKEYPNLIIVPVPVNTVAHAAFTKGHHFTVAGWQSLKPYSIAIRIGTKAIEHGTAGMNVTAFPTDEKVFLLVAQDRYDVCVSAVVNGLYVIKKHHLKEIQLLSPPLERIHLYHYLHTRHADLVSGIEASLEEMRRKGEIETIRENFVDRLLKSE